MGSCQFMAQQLQLRAKNRLRNALQHLIHLLSWVSFPFHNDMWLYVALGTWSSQMYQS